MTPQQKQYYTDLREQARRKANAKSRVIILEGAANLFGWVIVSGMMAYTIATVLTH